MALSFILSPMENCQSFRLIQHLELDFYLQWLSVGSLLKPSSFKAIILLCLELTIPEIIIHTPIITILPPLFGSMMLPIEPDHKESEHIPFKETTSTEEKQVMVMFIS